MTFNNYLRKIKQHSLTKIHRISSIEKLCKGLWKVGSMYRPQFDFVAGVILREAVFVNKSTLVSLAGAKLGTFPGPGIGVRQGGKVVGQ